MFNNLYLTIRSLNELDDSIIDPVSYALINWGVEPSDIDWDIYSDKAKLEINLEDDNYRNYSIDYMQLNQLMELCYDLEVIMTIIDNDGVEETYTTYHSDFNSSEYGLDVEKVAL